MNRRSTPPGRRRATPSSRAARGQRASGGRTGRRSDSRLVGLVVIVGLALISGAYALGGLTGSPAVPTPGPAASNVAGGCPTSQPAALAAGETRTITIATAKGNIVIKVDGSLSPIAAGNFVALAQCGFYDGLVFHRTASLQDGTPFVIQGGDPSGNGSGGPGYTIQDEPVTATYKRGTVAMARTSQPNSQGSQFFIVLDDRDGPVLAQANTYAIFGTVTSGMDVADAIFQASKGAELPTNPIVMDSVTVTSP
ncbi:MAG TPA: peptidylprolyl isomerase [Candidatus Limnocylindrales bacterium]|nr:peptidylprolyl isomerase [Candidatus Limnocylindrales bacterium]